MGAYENDRAKYTLDQLAAAAGMTARNVRAYRTRGLLPPPFRVGRETRYGDDHLDRLHEVTRLRDAGVPLKLIEESAQRGQSLGRDGELFRIAIGSRDGHPGDGSIPLADLRPLDDRRIDLDAAGRVEQSIAGLAARGLSTDAARTAVTICVRVAVTLAEELARMLDEGEAGASAHALLAEVAASITRDVLRENLSPGRS